EEITTILQCSIINSN
ncbi:Bgt-50180, partial [Blumeria graminis f. sp. tritici]